MYMPNKRGGRGPAAVVPLALALCTWLILLTAAEGCIPPSYTPPPRGAPPPRLKLDGPRIVDAATGRPVALKAINWFGFNVGQGAVDGLWAGGTDAATDFLTIVHQVRLLGFNAVRLPFRFEDLAAPAPDRTRSCRPSPEWQLARRVTDPRRLSAAAGAAPPPLPPPPFVMARPGGSKACNSYMPSGTGQDRLLWTMQVFLAHGMYVILDYHASSGSALERGPTSTAGAFAAKWAALWSAATCTRRWAEDGAGRVIADILNEPDMLGLSWGPIQSLSAPNPNWATLALAAMDAIAAASPGDALFMVSGTGQTNFGLNWGNGYITDGPLIRQYGLSDPNPFFRELVRRPYARSAVILGPHCYPPSVTLATYLGQALRARLDASFGYLQTRGYCGGGSGGGGLQAASLGVHAKAEEGGGGGALLAAAEVRAQRPRTAAAAVLHARWRAHSGGDAAEWSAAAQQHHEQRQQQQQPQAEALPDEDAAVEQQQRRRSLLGLPLPAHAADAAAALLAPPHPLLPLPAGSGCMRFPVVIGEFGSAFEQPEDVQWLQEFGAWLKQQSAAAGAPLGWAYWALNANSGDTGGIVSPSWQTFMWAKIRLLEEHFGLRPWYSS